MPDPSRLALERALALAREQVAALEAALGDAAAADSWVPVKVAAERWGITENAALKRAKRGLGEKRLDGRWYVHSGRISDGARSLIRAVK